MVGLTECGQALYIHYFTQRIGRCFYKHQPGIELKRRFPRVVISGCNKGNRHAKFLQIFAQQHGGGAENTARARSEEHTSELQSRGHLVCRLLLEKKKKQKTKIYTHNHHE